MKFIAASENKTADKAYFAGGCFWGVEHLLQKIDGVKSVKSGYSGGDVENPSYEQVCSGTTGHYEAVKVEFDPQKTDFKQLAKAFFEIHDYSQQDGQGPDIGSQYRSAIFYTDEKQKEQSQTLINILESRGKKVATQLLPFKKFWPAENYHQDYYQNKNGTPYCHRHVPIKWND
jgi:peptide methionine sulfoxide reductase msrA/msrB